MDETKAIYPSAGELGVAEAAPSLQTTLTRPSRRARAPDAEGTPATDMIVVDWLATDDA